MANPSQSGERAMPLGNSSPTSLRGRFTTYEGSRSRTAPGDSPMPLDDRHPLPRAWIPQVPAAVPRAVLKSRLVVLPKPTLDEPVPQPLRNSDVVIGYRRPSPALSTPITGPPIDRPLRHAPCAHRHIYQCWNPETPPRALHKVPKAHRAANAYPSAPGSAGGNAQPARPSPPRNHPRTALETSPSA